MDKMNSLKILADVGKIQGGMVKCDDIMQEFNEFVDIVVSVSVSLFKNFEPNASFSRIDAIFEKHMGRNAAFHDV